MKRTKNYNILNDCREMYEDEIFNIILEQRGIKNIEEFLYPTEGNLLPLDSLYRIDEAYKRLHKAIEEDENIGILFDTDTDGVGAGAIMTRYLKNFTSNIHTFIDKGKQHGLAKQNLSQFKNLDLLIIVDSLDNNVSQYKELHDMGIDIIILD